ncbi:MAG: hypothetical protein CENE_00279 [Candidatus Celerinatantimonas neptuna]|nr:MAG: hypothetical protein CENE_00279 [Candidatus Celerinatantimonas neptuna]
MGIVKISDQLHDEIRRSSQVMARSINAQAEFWIRMGMYAERHPTLSYHQLVAQMMKDHPSVQEAPHE